MTIDLNTLEATAKAATPGPWENGGDRIYYDGEPGTIEDLIAYISSANPATLLELVTELRKARAERDWMAKMVVCRHDACAYPCKCNGCPPCEAECVKCWLKAAREAVEGKQ